MLLVEGVKGFAKVNGNLTNESIQQPRSVPEMNIGKHFQGPLARLRCWPDRTILVDLTKQELLLRLIIAALNQLHYDEAW